MKRIKAPFFILLISILLASCTDKSIDIEVEQDACKRFKISRPSYQLLEDPCNNMVSLKASISFEFNRSSECLDQVNNFPFFYRSNNSEISPSDYTRAVERADLLINDKSVTYTFGVQFSSLAEAQELNHIVLDFNTQDELGVEGNVLQIRINTSCSTLDSTTYELNKERVTIPPSQSLFTLRLWDNAAEDGDIVSVYLNEKWIIENHSLLNAGTDFTFSTSLLNPGSNDLVVFALNEGSSGPNTVSIAVNGKEIPNFKPGLLTGEGVRINF